MMLGPFAAASPAVRKTYIHDPRVDGVSARRRVAPERMDPPHHTSRRAVMNLSAVDVCMPSMELLPPDGHPLQPKCHCLSCQRRPAPPQGRVSAWVWLQCGKTVESSVMDEKSLVEGTRQIDFPNGLISIGTVLK